MTTSPREYRRVVLDLLPRQGELSEAGYLWLTDRTNRLIEFANADPEPSIAPQGPAAAVRAGSCRGWEVWSGFATAKTPRPPTVAYYWTGRGALRRGRVDVAWHGDPAHLSAEDK